MTLSPITRWNALSAAEKRDVLLWGTRAPSAAHKRVTVWSLIAIALIFTPSILNMLL